MIGNEADRLVVEHRELKCKYFELGREIRASAEAANFKKDYIASGSRMMELIKVIRFSGWDERVDLPAAVKLADERLWQMSHEIPRIASVYA